MSAREFKPGDVAMIRVGTGDWEYGLLREDGVWLCQHPRLGERRAWEEVQARPLVVIDPESLEDQEALAKALVEAMYHAGDKRSAAAGVMPATVGRALNALADPKPRIEEPTGLGAVVEDAEGQRWVRMTDYEGANWHRWNAPDDVRPWRFFRDIDVVRVLSEGVTS